MNQKEAETLSSPSEAFSTPANAAYQSAAFVSTLRESLLAKAAAAAVDPGSGALAYCTSQRLVTIYSTSKL